MIAMTDRLKTLAETCKRAIEHSPALARRLKDAGLSAEVLAEPGALNRLPVLKKSQLIELQEADPPFAGFLGCPLSEVSYVFASPGPIFEPLLASDNTGHGMAAMFRAAGIGPGDIALNTWAYHLVPAGLLFDQGLRHCGATVIPAGPGNTELQARMIRDMGVTAFLGSTAYFQTVADACFPDGKDVGTWSISRAFLGGEFGDWTAKRKGLEARYGVKIWSCYATADLGLVGFEEDGLPGYTVHDERFVQICNPETGDPLGPGETGEIVVSTLSREWPLMRFGTGDLAHALELDTYGFATRISPLEGRSGEGVKVREIFVYPRHIRALSERIGSVREARAKVTRQGSREAISLELQVAGDPPALEEIENAFRQLTRLKPDSVAFVENFTVPETLQDLKDAADKSV